MNKNVSVSAGLLALLAVAFHLSNPPAGERRANADVSSSSGDKGARPGKQNSPTDERAAPVEGPWLATQSFFHREPAPGSTSTGGFRDRVDLSSTHTVGACVENETCRQELREYFGVNDCAPGTGARQCEFLISTVADPLHTRLALLSDESTDALEKAAEAADWEFARQWLPWYDTADPRETEPAKRRADRAETRQQEMQPGLLIFRHQSIKDHFSNRLLFVFIVGETPTAGINGFQFQLARAYMKAFSDPDSVRIQGPTFSGSFSSLAELINDDKRLYPGRQYSVRTGTATNDNNARALTGATQESDFRATAQSAADTAQHLCEVVKHLRSEPAAILVEEETAYAHGLEGQDQPDCQIQRFTFPREISHLRNAYREAVGGPHSDKTAAPEVSFSLKDPDSGEDSVPVFSNAQTPLAENAVLAEITNEIRRKRIRIVAVAASNVLDELFVARVLREQCPDTRLLIEAPDLLFVQAAQSGPLTGILALSSYPLFFARKDWMGDRLPIAHSSLPAEGVFNAALLLLAQSEGTASDRMTIESRAADYHWGSHRHAPCWLMTLDRFGFSPVMVMSSNASVQWFDDVSPDRYAMQSAYLRTLRLQSLPGLAAQVDAPALEMPYPPRSWTLLVCLLAIFSLCFTGWIAYLHYDPYTRRYAALDLEPKHAADFPRLFCLFVCLLGLVAIQAVLFIPLPLNRPKEARYFVQAVAWVGMAAPLALACILAWRYLWGRARPANGTRALFKTPRDFLVRRLATLAAGMAFAACILIWTWCCYGRPNQSFFFSFRCLELRPGSSPILPILSGMLALFIFSMVSLHRFYLATAQKPPVCTSGFSPALKFRLQRALREFNRSLLAPLNFRFHQQILLGGMILAAASLIFVLCRVSENLSSIDGPPYDFLCGGLQILLVLALLLTCYQIKISWSSLRSFLISLNRLPVAPAFTRLGADARSSPIWVRRLNLQSLDIPIRSVIVLHNMSLVARDQFYAVGLERNEVGDWLESYRRELTQLFRVEKESGPDVRIRKTRQDVRRLYCRLQNVSVELVDEVCSRVLLPEWRTRTIDWDPEVNGLPRHDYTASDGTSVGAEGRITELYHLAQAFTALHFSTFAIYGVRQIQNLLMFLSLGFVLLVVSMRSYGFQSQQLIGRFLLVVFVVLGYITGKCLAEMERDPILSRIAGSAEGELSKEFYFKMVTYGALPLLGILASLFPTVSNFLFSAIEPTLEALH